MSSYSLVRFFQMQLYFLLLLKFKEYNTVNLYLHRNMTTWTSRTNPTTTRSPRDNETTNREPRKRPSIYIAPLEWVNDVIVHDEDDEIIYIISNTWKEVIITSWTARPVLDD